MNFILKIVGAIEFRLALLDYKYGNFKSYNEWAKKWGFELEDILEVLK
jgi:hypothetical protein